MKNYTLKIGDKSENGQITIIDEDRLCYLVKSNSKGAIGLRTISKSLLKEFYNLLILQPDITANEARNELSGKSEIDKFEYGYASTLMQMAQMMLTSSHSTDSSVINRNPHSSRQVIYYGAPGTGKSHKIKEILAGQNIQKENIFRTTFHPDSDYSTFVGAYKPTRGKKPLYGLNGSTTIRMKEGDKMLEEETITYNFIPQAFLNAYIRSYQTTDNVYLIIEEINRGNCAQIFGDLFQLLDRDEEGKSEYTIKADTDLKAYLEETLGTNNEGIKDGEICLPSNLYIYATMNTSDQSLFPIDSAFKRRWDWEYEPIKYKNTDWVIDINGEKFSWVSFQRIVNSRILASTNSEDKMLGDFFVNPHDKTITDKLFLNKVLFYLWNDVCKDGEGEIFKTSEDKEVSFSELYGNEGTQTLIKMMEYLGVEKVANVNNTDPRTLEEEEENNNENSPKKQPKYSINGSTEKYSTPASVKHIIEDFAQQHEDMSAEEMVKLWNEISERNNCLVASWEPSPNDNQRFADKRRAKITWGDKSVWVTTGWTEELFLPFIRNVKDKFGIIIEKTE
ncbi:MAG: AAA family ATPase [Bacteroidetes bacterium]|uniref:AAA family ATPase n=1 Tax=Candidatus Gallipaludibacter merdavium TaxID=2840839 RepID=A0A9D9N3S6_9BACT|nr:AAA family ATPase [Candidatus Gallipaludibacter merdavium]